MQRVKIQEHLAEKWFSLPYSPWVSINTVRFLEQKVLGIFFLPLHYIWFHKKIFSPSLSTFIIRQIVPTFRENLASTVHCTKRGRLHKEFFSLLGKSQRKETIKQQKGEKRRKEENKTCQSCTGRKKRRKRILDEEEDVDEKRRRGGTGK